ncbi:unnamed protein product [Orchesella dallaii]|uniref:E3 ubiquitin protein ligase n=1 Tax=Orchesella dallaii TaxID=48710 RepID=A0ABP1PXT0_9HEXA
MSAVKRPPDEPGADAPPPLKKKVLFEPLRIGPVSTLEEMDIQILRFQHQKLKQRLELRQKQENDLRERIEQLEKRQTQDDAVLNVINRYWNQLNEDIRILLQRFDAETSDESENKNENEATTSFLTQLSTWDKDELDEKLANRVQVSTRAVAKIIQAFDRLQQRNEKITKTLKGELGEALPQTASLDDAIKDTNIELETENRRIQALNTSLHEKYHAMSLKMKELQEKLTAEETKGDELQNQVDDLNWEVSKLISQNDKLINHITDLTEKYRRLQQLYGSGDKSMNDLAQRKVEMSEREVINLQKDNEELRELANNRLIELERLHLTQRETLKELEKLRMDIRQLPESIIVETTEFKCLQSKFSVVYNDNSQLRSTLDETKQHLYTMRTNHLKHIEQMESEELLVQKKLRTEMIQLEDMLGQVRKEYEMLRVEFEQNLAANEQTGPINREMRHLITSLQNHNQQLKGDAHRYRKKYKEMCTENAKLKRQKDEIEIKMAAVLEKESVGSNASIDGYKDEEDSPTSSCLVLKDERSSEASCAKKSDDDSPNEAAANSKGDKTASESPIKKEVKKDINQVKGPQVTRMKSESECIKELRSQLKKALNDQREMKLLLDMYKGASKDQRDKVQLMASERKSRQELDELKQTLKKLQENKKEERKKLADEDAMKRIKTLEEQVHALQRQVTAQKQEEEALISEMEVTGQAFEDMQEQNSRLIQQLREKDDANFKLMSDRIKSNQHQKLAREERELLQDQVGTLSKQVEAQNQVVRKLEEKERLLLNSIASMEKEAVLRQQAMELHKRKAIESAQSAADLKLHLEKYHSQMKDAQQTVAEKTSALEAEAYKTKRLQEEIAMLRRKVERLNKIEMAGNTDEVMMEEIREYKETLTCPSCKVKRKDAVLIKCFHVFCFDCLRTRYETRQRKCPKCNAAFGANDYHRLYLS